MSLINASHYTTGESTTVNSPARAMRNPRPGISPRTGEFPAILHPTQHARRWRTRPRVRHLPLEPAVRYANASSPLARPPVSPRNTPGNPRCRAPAGWLFSAFEMPVASRYHLLCGMVRPDAATSSATPSDRSPRSATGSLTKRPRRYTRGAPCRARAHGHGVKESSGSPLRRNDALRDGTLIFAHLRRCALSVRINGYQCSWPLPSPDERTAGPFKLMPMALCCARAPPPFTPQPRASSQNWKSATLMTNCPTPIGAPPHRVQ